MNALLGPAELEALGLSLNVAARSVGFSLPLAVLAAWVLTRTRFPGRTLFDAFVHLPLVLPPVAVGYVLLVLFGARGVLGGVAAAASGYRARLHDGRRGARHRGDELSAHGAGDPPVAGECRPGAGRCRAHPRRRRPSTAS